MIVEGALKEMAKEGDRMKGFNQIKNVLSKHKEELKGKYKVKYIGIFGSFVRNEQKRASDVDILVEFRSPIGLFKFLELENYLANLLGVKVDLVSKKALKPRIGQQILREVVAL